MEVMKFLNTSIRADQIACITKSESHYVKLEGDTYYDLEITLIGNSEKMIMRYENKKDRDQVFRNCEALMYNVK